MAEATPADVVSAAIASTAEAAGVYVEDVVVRRVGKRTEVRIVVDLPADQTGSLDADALADASRGFAGDIDDADAVPGEYTLEVTTPGIDRPLTEPRHFARARGRLVAFRLADGSTVQGRVTAADDAAVTLADGTEIAYGDVSRAQVEVELNRIADGG